MKIPIGISDFKILREKELYYIDKTALIAEILKTNDAVLLLPRPRRFGKTLNLSMLRYFFEISDESNAHLFENTAIWQQKEYQDLQGTFPVIFITFKDCKSKDKQKAFEDIKDIITDEFKRHYDILVPTLKKYELDDYHAIVNRTASESLYSKSLFFLTMLLRKQYKKNVIVLIDEYDAPIQAAYTHGYYEDLMDFMSFFLSAVLKDNRYLERGILTGIMRTVKEGIFSGLNNIMVATILDNAFSDKFGFTQQEVDNILADTHLTPKNNLIKDWYNGYHCGTTTIYNPWSLLTCIRFNGETEPYWSNTSGNDLIKKIIAQADSGVKKELEALLNGAPLVRAIDFGLVFPGIENNSQAIWSLLLFAGYLTFTKVQKINDINMYTLEIPNKEIKILYRNLITSILQETLSLSRIGYLKESLIEANGNLFGEILQEFTLKSMSMFDLPHNEPERSYHLFVLGLLVTFSDIFEIKSNRESGTGRYDILLIPHDKNGWGIIIEFKKVESDAQETMEKMAQIALDQIIYKQYLQELKDRGVKNIAAFGVACRGKKTFVKSTTLAHQ